MAVFAQSCYNDNRGDGVKYMNSKQYDKAIRCFNAAKNCPDKPKNNDLDKLISQCFNLKNSGGKEAGKSGQAPKQTGGDKPAEKETPPPPPPLSVNGNTKDFSITVAPDNAIHSFKITSPSEYTVTCDKDWCALAEKSKNSFKNSIAANTKPRERNATMKIESGKECVMVNIRQEPYIPSWMPDGTTRKISSPAAEMPSMLSHIREYPGCRMGGLTTNRRGVVVHGDCDVFMTEELPESFKSILTNIQRNRSYINTLALTGSDYYCVVWDDNKWDGRVPVAMKEKLNSYINNNAKILHLSISDDGNFVILTDKTIYASRKSDMDLIMAAEDNYGNAKSIHITTYGICVVCDYGILYKNIPENLASALRTATFRPDHVTYTDGGTYILTSNDGDLDYNIR